MLRLCGLDTVLAPVFEPVSGRGIYTVSGSYGRQDGTQPVKPASEQRAQRQMTLRLILPLLGLAGVVFVLVILLVEVLDFSSWIEVFRRGFA